MPELPISIISEELFLEVSDLLEEVDMRIDYINQEKILYYNPLGHKGNYELLKGRLEGRPISGTLNVYTYDGQLKNNIPTQLIYLVKDENQLAQRLFDLMNNGHAPKK